MVSEQFDPPACSLPSLPRLRFDPVAPATFPFFTAANPTLPSPNRSAPMATTPSPYPAFPSATTYPPHPYGCYYPPPTPYPSSIQIHDGYYAPPPYLAGYGSSPPTFPNPHPTSAYAPPPGSQAQPYGPSTIPYATTSSCSTREATPIPTQVDPNQPPPAPPPIHGDSHLFPLTHAAPPSESPAPTPKPATTMGSSIAPAPIFPTTAPTSKLQPDPAPLLKLQDSEFDAVQAPPPKSTSPSTTAPPTIGALATALLRCSDQAPVVPLPADLSYSKAETNSSAFLPNAFLTAPNCERQPP